MLKLLLVDPAPSAVFRMVESPEILVMPVKTAQQALDAAKAAVPDVVLCDLTTPGLEGRAFVEELRKTTPGAKVLLTGTPPCKLLGKRLMEQGLAERFIVKPWPAMMIRNAVRGLVTGEVGKIALGDERAESALQTRRREGADDAALFAGSRFRLDGWIGEGGTGRVHRARDLLLDMPVALKLLHPRLSRDAEALAALAEEARILMGLSNRHIVRLFNLERAEGVYFLVMEYVGGGPLARVMETPGFRKPENILAVARAVAEALDTAHEKNVLHCDLTAGNVLVTTEGTPKLIDFGIAMLANQRRQGGNVMGTPAFMSPEQLRGEELDRRTDVFAFGVLLCQMLTGYLPQEEGWTVQDLAWRERPMVPGVPEGVARTLAKALAVRREDRWASAGEMCVELVKNMGDAE
ncbi:MAG: protein kinase [Kiritimatiellaeota bacterium]|nr:protein kinase [Kiritimatiellota bacterium]